MTEITIPPIDNRAAVVDTGTTRLTARLSDAVDGDSECNERMALDWLRHEPAHADSFIAALLQLARDGEAADTFLLPFLHGYRVCAEHGIIVVEGIPALLLKYMNFNTRFPDAYKRWLDNSAPYVGAFRVYFSEAGVPERMTVESWEVDEENTEDGEIVTWQQEHDEYAATLTTAEDDGPELLPEGAIADFTSLRNMMDEMKRHHGIEWSDAEEVVDALHDVFGLTLDTTIEVVVKAHA